MCDEVLSFLRGTIEVVAAPVNPHRRASREREGGGAELEALTGVLEGLLGAEASDQGPGAWNGERGGEAAADRGSGGGGGKGEGVLVVEEEEEGEDGIDDELFAEMLAKAGLPASPLQHRAEEEAAEDQEDDEAWAYARRGFKADAVRSATASRERTR